MYEPTKWQREAYLVKPNEGDPDVATLTLRSGRHLPLKSRKSATEYMITRLVLLIEAMESGKRMILDAAGAACSFCMVAMTHAMMDQSNCDACFVEDQCQTFTVAGWRTTPLVSLWRTRRVLNMVQRIYRRHFE